MANTGGGEVLFPKQRHKPAEDVGGVLQNDAEEEGYKRYKHRCYRQLVVKSLLSFLLGLLAAFFFRSE